MPRKRDTDSEVFVNNAKKRATPKATPQKGRVAANGHKLPEPLPEGTVFTDVTKGKWKIGKSVGVGGFGEIYLASNNVDHPVDADAQFVMKIEHHNNGPLFAEMHFYHRVGKENMIQDFCKKKKMDYIGMPRFVASGSHEHKGIKYRFMVLDRFGEDLQKILNRNKNTFPVKSVFVLGIRILDILEYIHSFGYIHADVKASNLLLGYGKRNENKVYLIDFGLACRCIVDGKHKEYKPDLRKAHDGTIEFTSRDAHIGAHSRRGDLEILGYNMLQWLCGRLPWENNLQKAEYVHHEKIGLLSNVPMFMDTCFPKGDCPEGIKSFIEYISEMEFEQEPDYNYCKNIFKNALKKCKGPADMKLNFKTTPVKKTKKSSASTSDSPDSEHTPVKGRRKAEPKGTKASKDAAASSSFSDKEDSSLENPTPAMLLVMQRRLEVLREERKKSASAKAAVNKASSLLKDEVVQKYKEKRKSDEMPEVVSTKKRRGPRSTAATKETQSSTKTSRTPLATRAQSPTISRRNSYSPEV